MELINRWSSCQADYCSSSESSGDDFEDDHADIEDALIFTETAETKEKIGYTKLDLLNKLKENKGDVEQTIVEVLQDMTASSLDHLDYETDEAKIRKIEVLKRKLKKLKTFHSKESQERREKSEVLAEAFIAASQDSFILKVAEESEDDKRIDKNENSDKIYRKPLNKLKSNDTIKARTNKILEVINKEAEIQQVTPTVLMAALMHRLNYIRDRKLALQMSKVFRGEDIHTTQKVPNMKGVAIVARGRMGRTAFNYLRRMLKPHQVLFNSKIYRI